ncbi:MAG: hypothetical protein ABIH39_05830 [Candidatus Margulisiibacteriota bacterium]
MIEKIDWEQGTATEYTVVILNKLNEVIEAVNGLTAPPPRHINTEPLSDRELFNHLATHMRNISHKLDITEE